MTLLCFILGILLIAAIARYNESNSLFWKLFLSFMLGFAGTTIVIKTFCSNNERKGVKSTQECPTQASVATLDTIMYLHTNGVSTITVDITHPNPASQVYTPVVDNNTSFPSRGSNKIETQPSNQLIKPPEIYDN